MNARKVIASLFIVLLIVGGLFAAGSAGFRMGAAASGNFPMFGQRWGYNNQQPNAPAPNNGDVAPAPQQQQPQQPQFAPRQGRGFNNMPGYGAMPYNNRMSGFGGFSILGGLLKFIFTVMLIGFLLRLFFGRRMWGMGRWRGGWGHEGSHGVPPHFAEWHKRAHEAEATGTTVPTPKPPFDVTPAADPADGISGTPKSE